jgi:hypothetical protein
MANLIKTKQQIEKAREERTACRDDIQQRYVERVSRARTQGVPVEKIGYDWGEIMAMHPKVPRRYFFTLVAKVKAGAPTEGTLRESVQTAKCMAVSELMPVAPSPSTIASSDKDTIDFMSHIGAMLNDINSVRDWSLTEPDPETGKRRIKNPHYFMQAIRLRREVLDTTLKGYQEFWDLRKMQDFYDAIIAEVSEADPEVAARIIDRLQALNNERGLTISATP